MTKPYNDPQKWLNFELSVGQQLELEQYRRQVSKVSREKLEALLLDAVKMSFQYQNIVKGLLKKG
jgi:hypothetical protein